MRYRLEGFGGIIASDEPPFLAMVDREFMRELGVHNSPLWRADNAEIGHLSAPTEVHIAATNKCPNQCRHCYMNAGDALPNEMDTDQFKQALKELADFGVFHVALGGGEALAREDIFELAHYARTVGLVPNLTISGALLNTKTARAMTVFGQVNVSLDGINAICNTFREKPAFETAHRALDLLLHAGVSTGINCVVGRRNVEGIPDLFDYAARKGANEIEFLRFKPSGRARTIYLRERTTYEQNMALVPMLGELAEQHGVRAKIDCSFVPMLCAHNPPRDVLEATATYGCEAGNVLLGVRSNGRVSGCSFLEDEPLSVFELADAWPTQPGLERLRTWHDRAPEPCRSCEYLALCKGGCHAVALAVCGTLDAPDPDCPRVARTAQGDTA